MVREVTLSSIKDCTAIYSNGTFVFVCGKKTYLFRKDGTFITAYKDIRYPSKIAFLSETEAIVDSGYSGFYYLIVLENGEIKWSGIQKGRRMVHSTHFAISSDSKTIYDQCLLVNGSLCVDVIYPHNGIHSYFQLKAGYRVTKNAFCDENNRLCFIQTQVKNPDDDLHKNTPIIYQCGILELTEANEKCACRWKYQWEYEHYKGHHIYGTDGRYILYEDFWVEDMMTDSVFNLLENDISPSPQAGSFVCAYDQQRNLLTISYYAGKRSNIIIDCEKRKRIAQFERESGSVGFKGCIVGNEFWIGSANGIRKYPLPI